MRVVLFLAVLLACIGVVICSDCKHQTACNQCVEKKTWNPLAHCRWCPLDKRCHTYGAVAKNPCTVNQNIKDRSGCDRHNQQEPEPQYDNQLAYDLLLLSSVAYFDMPNVCMEHMQKNLPDMITDFEIEEIIVRGCHIFFDGRCAAVLAFSHSKQMIALAYRGTEDKEASYQLLDEIFSIFGLSKVCTESSDYGEVQQYFKMVFTELEECVLTRLRDMMARYPSYKVMITGHSLGGAVATIAAYELLKRNIVPKDQLYIYTYGSPRVGDKNFAYEYGNVVYNSWRLVHYKDCVTHFPCCGISCTTADGTSPYHVRTEVFFDVSSMTPSSAYEVCKTNEETNKCSHKYQGIFDTAINLKSCVSSHKNYFDIPVGSYCKDNLPQGRKKRALINISGTEVELSNKTCQVMIKKNGLWVINDTLSAKPDDSQYRFQNKDNSISGSDAGNKNKKKNTAVQTRVANAAIVAVLAWYILIIN